ncbi:MAG: zinc dependent phospholipase C family protein [Phycisphaerales bacterium]|nr:MAG: zinc dependent phospholipase C family protein [Phycisphaerales bacterium]
MFLYRWLPAAVGAVTYLLLSAEPAAAWGPATHVMLARDVLAQLALLPAAVAAVLTRHGLDYVYGSLTADVVLAKRLSRVKQFCHHWATGFAMFDDADDDQRRAFALGYLSHLAADTVAHNKYVPHQLMVSDTTVSFGHVYWELRSEQVVPEEHWAELRRLLHHSFPRHEVTMSARLDQAFLPFAINNRIFYSMNRLFSNLTWRRGARTWLRMSRWPLSQQLLAGYHVECVGRIRSVLSHLHDAPVLREDPNGTSALLRVARTRRHLRRMARAGVLTTPAFAEALARHLPVVDRIHPAAAAGVA